MIKIPTSCSQCGHKYESLPDWLGHREKTCIRKPIAASAASREKSSQRVYGSEGHRSWVDARNGRMNREQRIWIYSDNYRRDDRGRICRPMPNMGGHSILHGITKLDQDGIANRLLTRMLEPRREAPAVPFGAGL